MAVDSLRAPHCRGARFTPPWLMTASPHILQERLLPLCPHSGPCPLDDAPERAQQCTRVQHGMRAGEFHVVYQPIVDLHSGAAVGAEALLRWRHPERGWLRPGAFAESLHHADVAWSATRVVLEQIGRDLAALPAALPSSQQDGSDRFISLNIFPSQLLDGRLAQLIDTEFLARGGNPRTLMIELLESERLVSIDSIAEHIHALRARGLRVAIDDFGTGAWTLADLARIEFDAVKLARELLVELPASDAATSIATGALRILDALGTQAIVEGIETPGHIAWAGAFERVWGQGYAFARPQQSLADAWAYRAPIAPRTAGCTDAFTAASC